MIRALNQIDIRAIVISCFALLGLLLADPTQAASYSYSNTISGSVPDGQSSCASTLTRTINVPDSFTIGDVNVGLILEHPFKSDLIITLTSPGGTSVDIVRVMGGSADNFNVRLDDSASEALQSINHDTAAPYPQYTRRPTNTLAPFIDQNSAGDWTLTVCDRASGDQGSFLEWHLEMTDDPPTVNAGVINATGGQCAFDGDRGGLTVYTGANSQFQVERCAADGSTSKARQYYLSTRTPPDTQLFNSIFLRVGDTVFGAHGGSWFANPTAWSQISLSGGSLFGDGQTVVVYSGVTGGLTYTVTQTVDYIFPNDFYSVKLEVDVPAGNTEDVRLYGWTDIMLDGDDNGTCSRETTFPEFVIADNSAETVYAGYRQRSITNHWDRYYCGLYYLAADNYIDGTGSGDLPNTIDASNTDVGAAVQWDIGAVSGTTYTAEYDFVFSINEPTLTKRYGPDDGDNDHTIDEGDTTQLTFTLTNRPGDPAQGSINFTETLPDGVTIVGTPASSQCGGTVSTGTSGGRDTLTLTGGQMVGGTQTCTVVVDVTASVAGVYDDPASNISAINNLKNLAQAELTVLAPIELPVIGSCSPESDVVWYNTPGELRTYNVTTNQDALVRSLSRVYGDIAWSANGKLYGVDFTTASGDPGDTVPGYNIYEIDPAGGAETLVYTGSEIAGINSLTADDLGWLYFGSGQTDSVSPLWAEANSVLYRVYPGVADTEVWIDLNDYGFTTGIMAGDFMFIGNTAYLAWHPVADGSAVPTRLLRVDNLDSQNRPTASTTVTDLGAMNTPYINGMSGNLDGDIFAVSGSNNTIYRITPPSASGVALGTLGGTPYGATMKSEGAGVVCLSQPTDYSDAPADGSAAPAGGTSTYGNAIHKIDAALNLGSTITAETSASAGGDDADNGDGSSSDDGISSLPTLIAGATSYTIPAANISGAGSGTLHAWIDFDGNGKFSASEYTWTEINSGTPGDLIWSSITTMSSAGTTWARFRYTTDALTDDGATADIDERSQTVASPVDGEVEDYAVNVIAAGNGLYGIVFEDVNYGGGEGRDRATSSGVGINGVTVELYDAAGILVSSTTTANDGSNDGTYSFIGMDDGDYHVRVVNGSVSSTRSGSDGSELAVQVFRTDGTTAVGNEVGGRDPSVEDTAANAGGTLNTSTFALDGGQAQSVTPVTLSGTAILGIDFGFNFDTIVNTNNTGQGSFRQFILNSNLLDNTGLAQEGQTPGDEATIFMIPSAALTAGVARIAVPTVLPDITDTHTVITGLTQTMHIGDTNTGTVGQTHAVGVAACSMSVSPVNLPEVEIFDTSGTIANGLSFAPGADDGAVRGIAIYGFGAMLPPQSYRLADIFISGANDIVVEDNIVSATATGTNPGITDGSFSNGLYINAGSLNVAVRNNYIAYFHRNGVNLNGFGTGTVSDATVTGNHFIMEAGWQSSISGEPTTAAVSVDDSSNDLIEGNYVTGGGYEAFELKRGGTGNIWRCNTAENMDIGGSRGNGFYLRDAHSGSLIQQNVVTGGNAAIAASISGGEGSNNIISENSFYGNDALGIDLNTDGVTLNDANDGDVGANALLNFPQFDTTPILHSGSDIIVTGCAPTGATIELFESDITAGGAAPGDNTFGLTQDYGEGQTFLASFVEGGGSDTDATACALATDADGNNPTGMQAFSFTFAAPASIASGDYLTATATVAGVGTSEFSAVALVQGLDYSDAPTGYGDASHVVTSGLQLGAVIDIDSGSLASVDASGDGADDDGMSSFPVLSEGDTVYTLPADNLSASGTGNLYAWIDFDLSGTFDADEFASTTVTAGNIDGDLSWAGLTDVTAGDTFVRLRLTADVLTGASAATAASDGEVEDYQVTIAPGVISLAGKIFDDNGIGGTAHDGVIDSGEQGMAGVLVGVLHDADGNGSCDGTEPVLGSATTDASGDYQVTLDADDAGKDICLAANTASGYLSASENSGGNFVNSGSLIDDTMSFTLPSVGTAWAGLDFGDVRPPAFGPDNQSTQTPGAVALYPHILTAYTSGDVLFSTASTSSPVNSGWQVSLYQDADCDGELDSGDTAITNSIAMTAGQQLCVIARIFVPADAVNGMRHQLDITATFDYLGSTTASSRLLATDLTTVVTAEDGALELIKRVENISGASPYHDAGIEQVINAAQPGDELRYIIYFRNIGLEAITGVSIFDNTAPFTALASDVLCPTPLPASISSCTVTLPAAAANDPGYEGAIQWDFDGSLDAGVEGSVEYRVLVQ